jgi:hypothetical protein
MKNKTKTEASPITHTAAVMLGDDIEASFMVHRAGTRMLTFQRNSGVTGLRYMTFGLHLTEQDVEALRAMLSPPADPSRPDDCIPCKGTGKVKRKKLEHVLAISRAHSERNIKVAEAEAVREIVGGEAE